MARPQLSPEAKLVRRLRQIEQSGLKPRAPLAVVAEPATADFAPLPARIEALRALLAQQLNQPHRENMVFLICYDIGHDRVRRHVARYLQRKGLYRIQRSVFIGTLARETASKLHQTLTRIQQVYNNHDSILLLPLAPDHLRQLFVVGAELDVDLLLGNRSMLFF